MEPPASTLWDRLLPRDGRPCSSSRRLAAICFLGILAPQTSACVSTDCLDHDASCHPQYLLGRSAAAALAAAGTTWQPTKISKVLFAVGQNDNRFRSYLINQTDGTLTEVSSLATQQGLGLAVHPTLSMVYMSINVPNGASAFSFDSTTGVATAAVTQNPGNANTHRIRVMPDGSAVYWNTVQSGVTRIYRTPLNGSGVMGTPVVVDSSIIANSQFMNLDPTGKFLYQSNNNGTTGGTTMFQTNSGGALISQGNLVIAGTEVITWAAFHSDGSAMYGITWNRVLSYTIDPSTGVLTLVSSIPLVNAQFILIHPNDKILYVIVPSVPEIRLYDINADKSLSLRTTSAAGALSFDRACMDRGGRFLFLTKSTNPGILNSYKILSDYTLSLSGSLTTTANNYGECETSIEPAP